MPIPFNLVRLTFTFEGPNRKYSSVLINFDDFDIDGCETHGHVRQLSMVAKKEKTAPSKLQELGTTGTNNPAPGNPLREKEKIIKEIQLCNCITTEH